MIDFTTALAIAKVVLAPVEQAFLQQIGKQAAAGIIDQLKSLRTNIFSLITGIGARSAQSTSLPAAENRDPEELAAQILLAAKRDPDVFEEILGQYHAIKSQLDAARSTTAISASASESSAVTQTVIFGGNVHIENRQNTVYRPQSLISLSDQARELLLAAASSNGEVLRLVLQSGPVIQAGMRNFIDSSNPRIRAMWEGALSELQDLGFLSRPPNPKAEILHVTQKGFEHIDKHYPHHQHDGPQ